MKYSFALYCIILFWESIVCKEGARTVVGGYIVSIAQHPYMVQLTYYDQFICGGSIISPIFILTAGHCTYGMEPSGLGARVGSAEIHQKGAIFNGKNKWVHPQYDDDNLDYDVSLLLLDKRIRYDNFIKPVKLASINDFPKPGSYAVVAGWGRINVKNPQGSSNLRAVSVPVISSEVCEDWYENRPIKEFVICAGYENGNKDACTGDSGGPLVIENKQIGIVSWGIGCAGRRSPGVYTSIAHPSIRNFIKKISGL